MPSQERSETPLLTVSSSVSVLNILSQVSISLLILYKVVYKGSSGENDVRLYKFDPQLKKYTPYSRIYDINASIFNVESGVKNKKFLISAANSGVYYISI